MLFRGVSNVNLDAKGRMALPVRYRELIQEASAGQVVVTIDIAERCLLLYPLNLWEGVQAQIDALPNMDPTSRKLQRLLVGHAMDLEIDGSGRLLLPPALREHGKFEKKLILLGQGKKLEIWAEEVWAARRDAMLEEVGQANGETAVGLQSISL
ncbi:MAG: division/cell wall cluster transcriptional repressor MraZ [Gammaproteobacteria bacterium]|nr:division/cell wall cluster transcriptional repressor MraZ [Gammaproteobacteria bacterium]